MTKPEKSPADTGADLHADVLVMGAGPGGYTAAFRAADLGKKGGADRALFFIGRGLFKCGVYSL